MRIGLIAGPWITVPPITYGGTERVVDSLARGLVAAGHEVVLAAPADSECPVPRAPGMRDAEPAELGFTLSELSHVVRAYRGMGGVNLIHDHTLAGPLYGSRLVAAPVVTTIHSLLTPPAIDIYRAAAETVSIVAISRDQVSRVPELPVARIIHHGMDLSVVPEGSGKGGYACFVGRMSPDKGVAEAIAIAREAGIPLKIAVKMRAPDEKRYFEEVIQPLLGSNEELIGEISDADKYALMGEASVFLNPIRWAEPFGLVMIEALATGTPVVGTPVGAAPEIISDGVTGYLGSVDELAGLARSATALDRKACRTAVERNFSAARMVADHISLYEQILGKTLPSGSV
ncbi:MULTISPECIES: glycosyltransferase family 4 protein [Arthrobacter]|uniref:Glycosyltransferase family 4 protein n=1 Tax=Arthrobacter terricola TaxID=2547396 RepID=A0A4R5KHU2_9MICC|nr:MULTISPECIES: glycosyltransferase family 4 protein [Arthrobacter]MBT8161940.1 glycosyltransferase family 4 protein [Arthrobacter sp. GN70]TDF94315.1 glycosyltransferase family 4 protein [Arthrobacter terricola]